MPGQPLPDHGKQQYDTGFHGGNYTAIHPQFYRNTVLRDFRTPDDGDYDVLESVLPAAKKRGMKTICSYEDLWRNDVPNVSKLAEKDMHRRTAPTMCFNNPDHRAFLVGLAHDYAKSHDIDGLMWGAERQRAFSNALGAVHGGRNRDPGRVTCFCELCQKKGSERGINFERVKQGYTQLESFVPTGRSATRPVDGYLVNLWRLMLKYPELLAWEMLWTESLREVIGTKPSTQRLGWHMWHNNSFNPIYRAEQDLQVIAPVSDFLKIVIHHNCGGPRMASYIDSVSQTIYGDVPKHNQGLRP